VAKSGVTKWAGFWDEITQRQYDFERAQPAWHARHRAAERTVPIEAPSAPGPKKLEKRRVRNA